MQWSSVRVGFLILCVSMLSTGLVACGGGDEEEEDLGSDAPGAVNRNVDVSLSSGQAALPDSASVVATAQASIGVDGNIIGGTVLVDGIQAQSVHIHEGFVGQSGAKVVELIADQMAPGSWAIAPGTVLDPHQQQLYSAGGLYVNVHTAEYPDGALRGQILPNNLEAGVAHMTANQVVTDPNDTVVRSDGSATGGLTVNPAGRRVIGQVIFDTLIPRQVQLHAAPRGSNGPMLAALQVNAEDLGIWTLPENFQFNEEQFLQFQNGELYFVAHSFSYPKGELRGQIEPLQ